MKCPATKQVQQKDTNDPPLFSVTYFNHRTSAKCSSRPIDSTTDIRVQSSSKKAVSICFNSHATSEQRPHSWHHRLRCSRQACIHSFRADQQPDRSTYARQFQWEIRKIHKLFLFSIEIQVQIWKHCPDTYIICKLETMRRCEVVMVFDLHLINVFGQYFHIWTSCVSFLLFWTMRKLFNIYK